jgi:hypothetical protein
MSDNLCPLDQPNNLPINYTSLLASVLHWPYRTVSVHHLLAHVMTSLLMTPRYWLPYITGHTKQCQCIIFWHMSTSLLITPRYWPPYLDIFKEVLLQFSSVKRKRPQCITHDGKEEYSFHVTTPELTALLPLTWRVDCTWCFEDTRILITRDNLCPLDQPNNGPKTAYIFINTCILPYG